MNTRIESEPEPVALFPDQPLSGRGGLLRLNLTDVTGFNSVVAEVPRTTTVAALARSMVDRWSLPTDTPWGLRSDDGLALEEDQAVGDQISGDDVTLTLQPKAHLG